MVTALVQYYQATQDSMALRLARRFVDTNLRTCFGADGSLRDWAGYHLHSITGVVESIIEYGLLINEQRYILQGKHIFDVGLRPHRSSYGWVKENLANDANDGEANNTGDLLRAALLLGRAGYPEYYEIAEKMFHNHLLASQLLDVEWIQKREARGRADESDRTYTDIGARSRGGFGFTSPNDWVFDTERKAKAFPLNADLVQGAVQAMVAVWQHAVSEEGAGTKVNLFVDKETSRIHVESRWPETGEILLLVKQTTDVLVRQPAWIERGSLQLRVNGENRRVESDGLYLLVSHVQDGDRVQILFQPRRHSSEEHINHRLYQLEWLGDRVVRIDPAGMMLPLYSQSGKTSE
jgi:hypothetical protein